MKRDILISEIISFCFDYGVMIDEEEVKSKIDSQLEDVDFLETLINTIIIKAKQSPNVDLDKVKELLLELEIIRLELEYKDYSKV